MRMVDERREEEQTKKQMLDAGAEEEKASALTGKAWSEADTENPETVMDESPIVETRLTDLIYQYIKDNYMYDISMQEVARTMNYSEAYFCKLFKQYFGKNFTTYLTEYRIETAKKMLKTPTVNIKEIGKAVGYADSNYFAKVFKRVTGESPSEYRGHEQN